MSSGQLGGRTPISLDELTALNDEMAALVRAGVPLEQALLELGRDMPGELGRVAQQLGQQMAAGQSLVQVLASQPQRFPPVWRAVVEAGARSGRLAAALESLSNTARLLTRTRSSLATAWVYPLVVLALAYVLLLFQLTRLSPLLEQAWWDLTSSQDWLLAWMTAAGKLAPIWAPWLPLFVAGACGLWWYRSGRLLSRQLVRRPRRWALASRVLWEGRRATLAEVLALLLEHQLPLDQAISLAAHATGDRQLAQAADAAADQLRHGERPSSDQLREAGFPPVVALLLAAGAIGPATSRALRQMAAGYRQRADRAADWATVYLPVLLTATLGAGITLLAALGTFGPFWRLLWRLGMPV